MINYGRYPNHKAIYCPSTRYVLKED